MNALLVALLLALGSTIAYVLVPVEGSGAVLVCYALAIVAAYFIYRSEVDSRFLLQVFAGGLLARMLLGTAIFVMDLQDFFGGDAITYDNLGYNVLRTWEIWGLPAFFQGAGGVSGWGMLYIVAAIYGLVGRNMLSIQFFNAVLGPRRRPSFTYARTTFFAMCASRASQPFSWPSFRR
ncbi:MAG: hypothetical protein WKF30_15525 [Pyrinomonadaceae bacterium]